MYIYVYFIFFLSFKSFQVGGEGCRLKGERNWFPLAIVSPAPRTCLSPRQASKCAQLETSENL